MMDNELVDIFDDCLSRLAAGETVEQVLRRYAAYDAALRPLLQTVRLAQRALPSGEEIAPARARGRARVLAELSNRPVQRARPKAAAPRWWLAVAALLLVCLGLGAVTANSLPGDPLYSLKRGVENTAASLSTDPQAVQEAARRRRIDEIFMLIALGRPAEVEFVGDIESLADDQWRISGLTVLLDSDTQRPDSARLGDRVAVAADVTAERTLLAREIRLVQPAPVEVTPEATAEPATATPALTATPHPSDMPQPTMTATATPTFTAMPTRTPPPIATQTPAETSLPSLRAGCTTQRPDGWATYSVRAGDSLSGLAGATGVTIDAIVQANCLPESGLIVVNQPLYLPLIPPTRAPAANPPAPTSASQPGGGAQNPPSGSSQPPVGGSNDDNNSGSGSNDDDAADDDGDNSEPDSNDDDDVTDNSGSGGGDDGESDADDVSGSVGDDESEDDDD